MRDDCATNLNKSTDHGENIRVVSSSFLIRTDITAQDAADSQSEICAKDMNQHRSPNIRNLAAATNTIKYL